MLPSLTWQQRAGALGLLAFIAAAVFLVPSGPASSASLHTSSLLAGQADYHSVGSPYKAIIADRSYAAHQQLADRARRARRHQRRLRERQSELASQAAPRPSPPAPTPAPAPALPPPLSRIQAFAYSLVGGSQFGCLKALWDRESGWNIYASNPSSGAYGIPQALPGSKMASAGPDWQTNPYTQVKWGVGYIDDSYGSACAAWSHEETSGWY